MHHLDGLSGPLFGLNRRQLLREVMYVYDEVNGVLRLDSDNQETVINFKLEVNLWVNTTSPIISAFGTIDYFT